MINDVVSIIRDAEDNYLNGTTKMGKYVEWSMHDTIERIDAYLNSRHTSGETDSMGRPKPFFNIVTAAVNIWYRATDIDRKDIRIIPDKITNTGLAFVATAHLQDWMIKARFGTFLNDWGRTLARYGSAVVKFVEKDGELIPSVVPWNRYIADPVDFEALPRIEKFYKTPAQLRKMDAYDQDVVDRLIIAATSRETLDGMQKDSMDDFIEIYEVHGELDSRLLDENPDMSVEDKDVKYRQQMHVVSYVEAEDGIRDFVLYKGKEKRDPYMITHLIPEDGRTLSIGAVEYLFDAQWMQNHTVKNMKDTLDIASKLIFQTSDTNYVGRNILSSIETGDIFTHRENMPLTRIANDKPDISALQNYGTMWRNLGQEVTSTPDALRGTTMPSGTPYSLGALLNENASSLFEVMTENKGLAIEDMLRTFVLPHIKTKMDTTDEIVSTLDDHGIAELDAMFVPAEAMRRYNAAAVKAVLAMDPTQPLDNQTLPAPFDQNSSEQAVRQDLSPLGNKRSFIPSDIATKTWKKALENFEWEVRVEVTNEASDKQAILTTLSTALQTIASNPGVLQDPNAKMLFNAILSETGRISPIQLTSPAQPTPQQAPPQQPMAAPPQGIA